MSMQIHSLLNNVHLYGVYINIEGLVLFTNINKIFRRQPENRILKVIAVMSSITPFQISVPEAKLLRLKQKLALVDFPDELEDVESWSRGVPLSHIKRLTRYWENGFDWPAVEAKLNKLPQFTAKVDIEGFGTYHVHFIYQRSEVMNAIPLLFLHGWPGSFIEVTKILPELVKGGDEFPAFHIVAPSLIDFGFSSASRKVCKA
jgi:hypothetical protein